MNASLPLRAAVVLAALPLVVLMTLAALGKLTWISAICAAIVVLGCKLNPRELRRDLSIPPLRLRPPMAARRPWYFLDLLRGFGIGRYLIEDGSLRPAAIVIPVNQVVAAFGPAKPLSRAWFGKRRT